MLTGAAIIALTGIKPLTLVDVSIIFGMTIMPATYYPVLRVAGDKKILREHANGALHNAVGWIFLLLITVCAVLAIPLMILTNRGEP
jgi:manganese transport protein